MASKSLIFSLSEIIEIIEFDTQPTGRRYSATTQAEAEAEVEAAADAI